jgi:hypothetical protein
MIARKTKHLNMECEPFHEEDIIEDPTTRVSSVDGGEGQFRNLTIHE